MEKDQSSKTDDGWTVNENGDFVSTQMIDGEEYTVMSIDLPEEDSIYVELANEHIRQSVPRLNDAITKLLTLAIALTGGSLALLKEDTIPVWAKTVVVTSFLASVVTLSCGSIPYMAFSSRLPPVARRTIRQASDWKRGVMKLAVSFIIAGCLTCAVGVIVKSLTQSHTIQK